MNVLSLFDGMSCEQIALDRAGLWVDNYFASEIDTHAIKVAKHNYPGTKHLGCVTKIKGSDLPQMDLIIGGSPCQGFSFAGKQLNFDDPRSKLFFEFVRLREETKAKFFFLENVKMKKEYQDIISRFLGVEPIEINSSLVSAQSRKRLYWTNIPFSEMPEDKGVLLKDIIHESKKEVFDIEEYIVPFDKTLQILNKEVQRGKIGYFRKDSQANRVYHIHDKSVTLCGEAGGGAAKMGQYLFGEITRGAHQVSESKESNGQQPYMQNRVYNSNGISPALTQVCGRLNVAIENDYLFGCITPDRVEKRQNGQRFNEGNKFYTLTAQDKHGILIEGYIRKLTPVECERLQTVPDNYTLVASKAQRYRMLGNGWTVDAITHFFKNLPTSNLDLY